MTSARSHPNRISWKLINPFYSNNCGLPGVLPVQIRVTPSGIMTSEGYHMAASPKTAPRSRPRSFQSTRSVSTYPQMGVISRAERKTEKRRHAVTPATSLRVPSSTRCGHAACTRVPHHKMTKRTQFFPQIHAAPSPALAPHTTKRRNEPNFSLYLTRPCPPRAEQKATKLRHSVTPAHPPHCQTTKRTQFFPQIHAAPSPALAPHTTERRNEPNFSLHPIRPCPPRAEQKTAKRRHTESHLPHGAVTA
jgi:hypothetical protein